MQLNKIIDKQLQNFNIKEGTRKGLIKYLFNTAWMFAEKVIFMAIAFFVGVYVAKYLGPTQYGLLNYAFSFVFIFQAFAKLGLDGIVIRELVNKPNLKAKILGTSFILKAVGSIISLLLIILSIQFTSSNYETKIVVIIIAIGMLFNTFEVSRFFFESKVKAKYNTIPSSISLLIGASFKIFFILSESDLIWFAVAYSVEIIVKGFGFILFYQIKNKDVFEWKFDANILKSLLKDSWSIMLSGIAASLFFNIDQIMVKEIVSVTAVGYYSVAVKISTMLYFIPAAINSSLFPAIVDAKKTGKLFYIKRLRQLFIFQTILAVSTTLLIFLSSSLLINSLYGEAYVETIPILKIYILSNIFIFFANTIAKWHLVENNQIINLYRYSSGALLNIILNLIFIPLWGMSGAAFATLISYAFVGYFSLFIFKDTRRLLKIINSIFLIF